VSESRLSAIAANVDSCLTCMDTSCILAASLA
jgi:hypothetical protein